MTVVLALSPHLDDAIFSAGGTLARASRDGVHVILATLFTGNVARPDGFALACQTDKGISPSTDYMAARRKEDRDACAILGVEAWHCALLEAPHRGYGNPAALFGPPHACDDISPLLASIRLILAESKPDMIWAPRAVGGHVDHVLVHRAMRATPQHVPIAWYTDFPYVENPQACDCETRKLGPVDWLRMALPRALRQIKADACAAYSSQLGFQFGGEASMRQRLSLQTAENFALGRT